MVKRIPIPKYGGMMVTLTIRMFDIQWKFSNIFEIPFRFSKRKKKKLENIVCNFSSFDFDFDFDCVLLFVYNTYLFLVHLFSRIIAEFEKEVWRQLRFMLLWSFSISSQ